MHISQLSQWTFPLQNIIQFSLSVEFFWKMIDSVQHLLKVHGFLCDSFNMHALNIHSQAPGEHQRPAKRAWPLLLMSSGSGDSIKSRKTSLIGLDGNGIPHKNHGLLLLSQAEWAPTMEGPDPNNR